MAEANDTPAAVPLGAQIMRKLHGGLKALADEVTKMSAGLDDCPAKAMIGEHVGGLTSAVDGLAKGWAKVYKGMDLDAADEPKTKADEPDGDEGDDAAIDEALRALDADDDDPAADAKGSDVDEEEEAMTPAEKSLVRARIRQLESTIRHRERLARAAAER
jgi:TATA-binding protein-associated factor Taf7